MELLHRYLPGQLRLQLRRLVLKHMPDHQPLLPIRFLFWKILPDEWLRLLHGVLHKPLHFLLPDRIRHVLTILLQTLPDLPGLHRMPRSLPCQTLSCQTFHRTLPCCLPPGQPLPAVEFHRMCRQPAYSIHRHRFSEILRQTGYPLSRMLRKPALFRAFLPHVVPVRHRSAADHTD